MDSKLVNEKAAAYGDRAIRINPAVMRQLGLEKQGSHLAIADFAISCIPFELSLQKASVLAFLSAKEAEFFEGRKAQSRALNLVGRSQGASKPVPFFVRCSVLAIRKPNPDSPYCFIDLRLGEAPYILKEMLVTYFVDLEETELYWSQAGDQSLSLEAIATVFPRKYLQVLKDGSVADRLRATHLSPRKLRLFGEYEGALPEKGELLDIESRDGEDSFVVQGPCIEAAPFAEAPGFAFVEIAPQFSLALASRMRGVASATH
jgi:hypothetical protein